MYKCILLIIVSCDDTFVMLVIREYVKSDDIKMFLFPSKLFHVA